MPERLALHGGEPVRGVSLPYGSPWIDDQDREAVLEVLRSGWLTTGPKVAEFERAFAEQVGAREAVAVNSGTAALHAAVHGLGIGPGDEVVVPALSFAASANCVVYQGATPVFADVDPDTLCVDPGSVAKCLSARTKAVLAVDYAGQPCDYESLEELTRGPEVSLIADACHSLGARSRDRRVGTLADASAFSLHPVKAITAAEGGVVTTNDVEFAGRMRRFRNHGISADHRERAANNTCHYEMVELGYNYRLSDLHCALALSQLRKLEAWTTRRRQIAAGYDEALTRLPGVEPLKRRAGSSHAYHLYVVRLDPTLLGASREDILPALRAEGIGVNVHYPPIHLHPFYRDRFATAPGLCPVAEAAANEILSLPVFPRMTDEDAEDVVSALQKVIGHFTTG